MSLELRCLAVDIGGTKIALAIFNQAGRPCTTIQSFPVPFDSQGIANPFELAEIMQRYLSGMDLTNTHLVGAGISLCGNVDLQTGTATLTPNLHWRNIPIGQIVQDKLKMPVVAATDVRDAALAEHTWGAAQGTDYFAWCTVGTGYGGYLFLDGKLYDGFHGFAGPFGHTTLDEVNGFLCGCGRRGCVETFVAGPAIARQGQLACADGRSPLLARITRSHPVTPAHVFQAAQSGDPACIAIIDQVIRLICINLSGLVNTLDLQMIVFGGGVTHALPNFIQRIDSQIRTYLMSDESRCDLKIIGESFCNSALYGAAADAFLRLGIPLQGRVYE